MPFKPPASLPPVLGSVLAAVIMLTTASCASHITPLGPDATVPQPHRLRSPIVLQAVVIARSTPAGACPTGSVALSGGPGQCYRKIGTPVTITSAAVTTHLPAPPAGQQTAQHGLIITVAPADQAALTAVTTTAFDAKGYLIFSVSGRTWVLPMVLQPFTGPNFEVAFPTSNQVLKLQRLLVPSG
jgi:hypothetical protein